MSFKGIVCAAALLAALLPAAALEERIELSPGGGVVHLPGPDAAIPGPAAPSGVGAVRDPILGGWLADNAVTVPGFRGGLDYVLAPASYRVDRNTDLLLHFEGGDPVDETGHWTPIAGKGFATEGSRPAVGKGAALFNGPGSALSLLPGKGSLLERGSRFRDFSIEFWLYPSSAENGERIITWRSLRALPAGSVSQSISCVVSGGRIAWEFEGFFERPSSSSTASSTTSKTQLTMATKVELRAADPLVPKTWSHHLLRFDGDTGLLEYLVDGVTEATTYATSTGGEGRRAGSGGGRGIGGADVFAPAIGAAAPLVIGADYSGLMDEFRISRNFVEKPNLAPFGNDPGLVLSPVADLGYTHSRLLSVEVEDKMPGDTGVELAYRVSDEWVGWNLETPEWVPFRPGQRLPDTARGRYVQIRATLYPDGTGRRTPALSSLVLHYEADPPPAPPAKVMAIARDGSIELRWSRVYESDVAGYLVYYGQAPGEYLGTAAAEGPSPIDAGNVLTYTLSGLPDGSLVYIVVAAYDKAAAPGRPAERAGLFSMEVRARPTRTAQ